MPLSLSSRAPSSATGTGLFQCPRNPLIPVHSGWSNTIVSAAEAVIAAATIAIAARIMSLRDVICRASLHMSFQVTVSPLRSATSNSVPASSTSAPVRAWTTRQCRGNVIRRRPSLAA